MYNRYLNIQTFNLNVKMYNSHLNIQTFNLNVKMFNGLIKRVDV
jgi:hypothetical protein